MGKSSVIDFRLFFRGTPFADLERRSGHACPFLFSTNYDASVVDAVETVSAAEAFHWARRLAREEGLLVGISTGANVAVAARLAMRPRNAGKTIVTFACSSGERYLSTPLYQLVGMSGSSSALDVTD